MWRSIHFILFHAAARQTWRTKSHVCLGGFSIYPNPKPCKYLAVLFLPCFCLAFVFHLCYYICMINLVQLPANRTIAHYEQTAQGFRVVTSNHKVLGASFYEIRNQYQFHSVINGAGSWVVLVLRSPLNLHTPVNQPQLF